MSRKIAKERIAVFGSNVRKRRLGLGLMPRLPAAAAGMDRANWLRIERCDVQPVNMTLSTALRVAEALETTVGKLLGEAIEDDSVL